MIRFGSVCSGIEAASVAWHPLGWQAAWLAEIEAFPSAVLAHHYPTVPNLGDMTTITRRILSGEVEAPDVFTGGTPCQAFSVAGLRRSLDDERGNLSLTFCEIADAIDHVRVARGDQPSIIVWENVPGVLSTKDNAFGCFLAGLAGEDGELQPPGGRWSNAGLVLGSTRAVAWRVLDAQYFGVAQRRRRVWVVASSRDGFDPAEVLFEWDRVRRDSPPSREAREGAAACTGSGAAGGGYVDDVANCLQTTANDYSRADGFNMVAQPVAFDATQITSPANRSNPRHGDPCHPLAAGAHAPAIAFQPTQYPISSTDGVTHAMGTGSKGGCATVAVAFCAKDYGGDATINLSPTLRAGNSNHGNQNSGNWMAVATTIAVRRLTPRECERLQGFPDDYTLIAWRNKPADQCPDGPRYKALGNSWAVPCARWIGERVAIELGGVFYSETKEAA